MLAETQTQVLPSAPGSALSFAKLGTPRAVRGPVAIDDQRGVALWHEPRCGADADQRPRPRLLTA